MAFSTQRATSDGTLVQLALSIDYFDRSTITVYFGGILVAENTVAANGCKWDWVGTTDKKIAFTPAIPSGQEVMIKRASDLAAPRHVYTAGAQFVAGTLDENFLHTLHIAQESRENAVLVDVYNNIDMHGYQLANLGTATQDNHPVTLAQYKADAAGASAARTAAEAARDAAKVSETNAKTSETNAASSASTSSTKAGEASTSATNAANSATAANTAKTAAETALDSFDDRYLGAKSAEPTLDNDGNALLVGALYLATHLTPNRFRAWSGSAWVDAPNTSAGSVVSVPAGTLSATNVQDALNELDSEKATKAEVDTKVATVQARTEGAAFSAYLSGNQAVAAGNVKVLINTEVFDVTGAFDPTNGRFQPSVAGYYQINAHIQWLATGCIALAILYKNGSIYKYGSYIELGSANPHSHVSDVVYLNGATDYVELYGYSNVAANVNGSSNNAASTYFSGALMRAA